MHYEAGWVSPSPDKRGLDDLGVQAPCINVYGRLVPGITNVTDRARYYSFYPWLLWALDPRGESIAQDAFVESFRRSDCLFTLIAERHARVSRKDDGNLDHERHGFAMVGRDTLLPALNRLESGEKPLLLSTHATREDVPERYFKNKWGGLGQYYRGTLEDLGLVVSDSRSGARFTQERGAPLALALDASVSRERFFSAVASDSVSLHDLDDLSSFCPCHLRDCDEEHKALLDLFLDRGGIYGLPGAERSRTLALLIHLAGELSEKAVDISQQDFVCCVYGGSLPGGHLWSVPTSLAPMQRAWSVYARNELLSLSVQSIFCAALHTYDRSPDTNLQTGAELADWFLRSETAGIALDGIRGHTVSRRLDTLRMDLPDIANWESDSHELRLLRKRSAFFAAAKSGEQGLGQLLRAALQSLLALIVRDSEDSPPYRDLIFDPDYFIDYPINLVVLRRHALSDWPSMRMDQLLEWLVSHWAIETHLRVALRKLRYDSRETFRIRPTDQGLEVVSAPEPVPTTPRFNQALQMMRDLGLLERSSSNCTAPSPLGRQVLDGVANG